MEKKSLIDCILEYFGEDADWAFDLMYGGYTVNYGEGKTYGWVQRVPMHANIVTAKTGGNGKFIFKFPNGDKHIFDKDGEFFYSL